MLAAGDELLKNKILAVHHFHCYAARDLHENICGRRADDDDNDDEKM